ncbi:Pentatricopeptide repeat-containing protein, chloroplastic [Colletotrichum tanaceti]|uniref:Pentatricopeptide repeat-containing protein, chloroplastic n=1 Tax=Colletotrichum tanaceti TaxID=1306861 RepID=A0A4U6XQ33_9PEZI|nr:Pentatricopeptide repeat-containing protein, chloroplastic [Colletotrichum tanaceti]TKW57878.1 Pentatricopeptide repeat-containing protein, chloroplastic [Colletotrichum tanaceti]
MLERTAATLESCTSFHALPSASRSLKTQRKLYTGFWQHGAAAIDISYPVLATQLNAASSPPPQPPIPPSETLAASTFLLDFLYPTGTAAVLRKFAPGLVNHKASIHRLPRRSRPFTSSVATPTNLDTRSMQYDQGTTRHAVEENRLGQKDVDPAEEQEYEDEKDKKDEDEAAVISWRHTHSGPSYLGAGSRPDLMRELMAEKDTEYFGSIWQLYSQLDGSLQPELRPEVMVYLCRSSNVIDARRILFLFSKTETDQWTPKVLTSAIAASLRLEHVTEAFALYRRGLDANGTVSGLKELLRYAFKRSAWKTVRDLWVAHHTSDAYRDDDLAPVEALSGIPNIGELVNQFASYVLSTGKMSKDAQKRLGILLEQAVQVALQQPCKPKEALPLLKISNSPKMYADHLNQALARGQRECLPEIYRLYREMPNAKLSPELLHGMFDVFSPNDVLGLEQVYEDFSKTGCGGLDKSAVIKYLRFYASRGDIKSVERLSAKYPKAQKVTTHSLYLMVAYSSLGDYQGAREVFDELRYKHRKTPNLMHWHELLKSCLREATYDRPRSVFDELCEALEPNAVTFAIMMSLAASKGDLDFTLKLLQQARSRGVTTDVPILKSVVSAYCRNDRLREALATCIEAKNTNVPGEQAQLWNVLLRRHADRRAFDDVCEVVALMGQHGVMWTPETHAVLLQALVACGQVDPAYKVLHAAVHDRSLAPSPGHFVTVTEGSLNSRQLRLARNSDKLMRRVIEQPSSVDARLAKARLLFKQKLFGTLLEQADGPRDLVDDLRKMAEEVKTATQTDADPDNGAHGALRRADSLHHLRGTLVKAIALFTRYRDFESARELRELQASLDQEGFISTSKDERLDILYSLMLENIQNNKYDAAKANWELIWQTTLKLARPASYSGRGPFVALPRYRYSLSKPFGTLQEMFLELQDPDGLKEALDRLLDAGFLLDARAMNHACQALARAGRWLDAYKLCEKYLMDNWPGWLLNRTKHGLKVNLPLKDRRQGRAPHRLRPTSYTLVVLAKEYSNLEGMVAWSSDAAWAMRTLQKHCPQLVHAIQTLSYTGLGIENEAFGRGRLVESVKRELEGPQEMAPADEQTDAPYVTEEQPSAGQQEQASATKDDAEESLANEGASSPVTGEESRLDGQRV